MSPLSVSLVVKSHFGDVLMTGSNIEKIAQAGLLLARCKPAFKVRCNHHPNEFMLCTLQCCWLLSHHVSLESPVHYIKLHDQTALSGCAEVDELHPSCNCRRI